MNREAVISKLKSEQADLTASGLAQISLFGSTARGEANENSDIDLAVVLDRSKKLGLFRFAEISDRLCQLLDARVDVIVEPTRNPRLQEEIDRDRVRVY
jgi:uncharacterized protein